MTFWRLRSSRLTDWKLGASSTEHIASPNRCSPISSKNSNILSAPKIGRWYFVIFVDALRQLEICSMMATSQFTLSS
jgi:hypothetical protein